MKHHALAVATFVASSNGVRALIDIGHDKYPAFNMHSVTSYKKGTNGPVTYLSDGGFDKVSWTSIIECFPDWRSKGSNYGNWACDKAFGPEWSDNDDPKFPCGDFEKGEDAVFYFLKDVRGHYKNGYHITCQMEGNWGDGSKRRVLYFPSGYFAFDNQVWLSPLTKVVGKANPNDAHGDPAFGEQTLFIAYASGAADEANNYNSFNVYDALGNYASNPGQIGYCKPPEGYNPQGWGTVGVDANVKQLRPGFLMHSSTDLANLNILGSDLVRPHESKTLCGGGAIETPGCVGYYGPNKPIDGQHSDVRNGGGCFDDYETNPNWNTNFNEVFHNDPYKWMTGGVINWFKEKTDYGGISHITINNVRANDPMYRLRPYDPIINGITNDHPIYWPASQVAFFLAGTPDGSYVHDVTINGLISMTTVADGLNLAGNAYNINVYDSFMGSTGDDAFGMWQGGGDQKSITIASSQAFNPGIRQGTQYGKNTYYDWGSCIGIFGCHEVSIKDFTCYDRYCPYANEPDGNGSNPPMTTMCTETGNGHMITFYPSTVFSGRYYWGKGDVDAYDGWCRVTVDGWKWLYQDDNHQVIDYSQNSPEESQQLGVGGYLGGNWPVINKYYKYINRDPAARCYCDCGGYNSWLEDGTMPNPNQPYYGPRLCMDGIGNPGNSQATPWNMVCQWVAEFEGYWLGWDPANKSCEDATYYGDISVGRSASQSAKSGKEKRKRSPKRGKGRKLFTNNK